jgi:hypothetical protein
MTPVCSHAHAASLLKHPLLLEDDLKMECGKQGTAFGFACAYSIAARVKQK